MPINATDPVDILKVTLMVAVGAFVLKKLSSVTGIGGGLTGFLP